MSASDAILWTDDFFRAVRPAVFATGLHRATPDWVSPVKDQVQTDYDIWYVASGGGAVRVDNQWHTFQTGDLIAIKPGDAYQQERTDPAHPFQIYFTHILPFGRKGHPLDNVLSRAWPLKMSLLHRPDFAPLFERLFEVCTTRDRSDSLAVTGLALQMLDIVFDELRRPRQIPRPPRAYANLLRAKTFIEAEYGRDLRLADVAAHAELSLSHLSALFTQHLGCPPMEYLLRVRLREVKLQLARGARVKEAAQATGFQSPHYLSRLFRTRTGMSPTEFARRHARPR